MPLYIENLKCGYAKPIVEVEDKIEFEEGKVYGIIGPNGSGKSTFIKALAGVAKVFEGKVYYNQTDIFLLSDLQRARIISYMPQNIFSNFPFTVFDVVMMGRYPHEKSRFLNDKESKKIAEEKIDMVNLTSKKQSSILQISGGERQRTSFARVLAQESRILLLDEPNSNLDITHQERILDIVKNEVKTGKIAIMALHNIKLAAKFCNIVFLMKHGKIVDFGRPQDVINPENIKKVYNVDAIVYKNPFGIYDIELIQKEDENGIHVHVVAGGGAGQELYKILVEMGFKVTTGVLATNDTDYETAQALSIYTIFTKPFMPIGEEEYIENVEFIKKADFCILCNIPFGIQNIKNLEALRFAKKLFIIEKEDISKRDFTGGIATNLYNNLKEKAVVVNSLKELKSLLQKENAKILGR
ncbi:ABC transporter ATP-binding protein [Caldicellulosiruptor naganoensis]|uniref:ABC transporter ATP-binding protein n=1 Tax=Caldicellulosiruptor naganoensis TaxID=29324 RepID=A0ABY7BJP6_9FIRM|nr:ABC transporter ATP-binding protein [Caldicellulosiruptor naganoensis]WAM32291.1 ABC transporter ATP-binding protein [Caldicellulosiruptor naganoensis]